MSRAILIAVSFSLSACNSVSGGCPPLIHYSADMQRLVAKKLRELPPHDPLAQMVVDYKKFRDACRVGD